MFPFTVRRGTLPKNGDAPRFNCVDEGIKIKSV